MGSNRSRLCLWGGAELAGKLAGVKNSLQAHMASLSGRISTAYDMFSGAFFSTYQTSINGFVGFYIKAYINDLRGVYYKDNSLNPYGF